MLKTILFTVLVALAVLLIYAANLKAIAEAR